MAWLKILIIRHALSFGNEQRRMMGHGNDDLSPTGIAQAQKLAQQLGAEHCIPTAVYSSPLTRAMHTARLLLKHGNVSDVSIEACNALKEFHNGIFQGLTWDEAQQEYPDLCQILEASLDWVPIPEAESLQAGRDRAHRFIQHLIERHDQGGCIWVISHEWIMQHLIAELLGGDRTWGISIPPTSRFEFWLNRDRWFTAGQNRLNTELWNIRKFNDTTHL